MFLILVPMSSSSFGSCPLSISPRSRLPEIRRKYSWRGLDIKDRESVAIPMKRESSPQFASACSCHSTLSFDQEITKRCQAAAYPEFAVPKIADHGRKDVVILRVCVVNDGFRQEASGVQPVEVSAEGVRLRPIADRVETRVRSESLGHPGVYASHRAEVQLFGPAFFGIEPAEEKHHVTRNFTDSEGATSLPARAALKIVPASPSVQGSA
jgi:hypothetical protein